MNKLKEQGIDSQFVLVGRKGEQWFIRRPVPIAATFGTSLRLDRDRLEYLCYLPLPHTNNILSLNCMPSLLPVLGNVPQPSVGSELANLLVAQFLTGEVDACEIIFTRFNNLISYVLFTIIFIHSCLPSFSPPFFLTSVRHTHFFCRQI